MQVKLLEQEKSLDGITKTQAILSSTISKLRGSTNPLPVTTESAPAIDDTRFKVVEDKVAKLDVKVEQHENTLKVHAASLDNHNRRTAAITDEMSKYLYDKGMQVTPASIIPSQIQPTPIQPNPVSVIPSQIGK